MVEVLVFTGSHCASCGPVKRQLATLEVTGLKEGSKLTYIDVDNQEGARKASTYSVLSLPTAVVLKDGSPFFTALGSSLVTKLKDKGFI